MNQPTPSQALDLMWRYIAVIAIALVAFVLLGIIVTQAQKATEIYIPIGQSPGLSKEGKTILGVVTNFEDKFIVITNKGLILIAQPVITVNGKRFIVGTNTDIYLDRSLVKKSNSYGLTLDLTNGTYVEIWATNNIPIWIKARKDQ